MFPKQSSKNRHVRSPETHGAHNPEAQIINKRFDKTKEKICFQPSLMVLRAPINEKSAGRRHLSRRFCMGGAVRNRLCSMQFDLAGDRRERRLQRLQQRRIGVYGQQRVWHQTWALSRSAGRLASPRIPRWARSPQPGRTPTGCLPLGKDKRRAIKQHLGQRP